MSGGSEVPKSAIKRKRGIYLLPNLFTTAALFSGFFAVLSAINENFEHAAIALFVAMLLDGLDGRVARFTNTQTVFGAEYDSLSDMVAFGLAPAMVIYLWALQPLGKFGWFAAFIYVVCTALRLARFNTQIAMADKGWFMGLPSPAASALIASWVWLMTDYGIDPKLLGIVSAVIAILAAAAMVSSLWYYSFKEINFQNRVPFFVLVFIALAIALILSQPAAILFLLAFSYAISGLVTTLIRYRRKHNVLS